jgi:TATA-box binding protein (TBP) (component of TFIID and TFIIIB)
MTLLLDDFSGKPCNRGTAYEFFPKKQIQLNLNEFANNTKFEIQMQSKFLIILTINEKTVSIFHSGKIMVRGEKNEKLARAIAKKVLSEFTKYISK